MTSRPASGCAAASGSAACSKAAASAAWRCRHSESLSSCGAAAQCSAGEQARWIKMWMWSLLASRGQ